MAIKLLHYHSELGVIKKMKRLIILINHLLEMLHKSISGMSLTADLGRPKRALFDESCKGVYDRHLFSKLDRVCEDCYNLYRTSSVSYECRYSFLHKDMFINRAQVTFSPPFGIFWISYPNLKPA